MIIYRAMCEQEMIKTLKNMSFQFDKKNKWFSYSLGFILNRVKDGKFNNSNFCKDRYEFILMFILRHNDLMYFNTVGNRELMLNVRKSHNVKILQIEKL